VTSAVEPSMLTMCVLPVTVAIIPTTELLAVCLCQF
jgi:hypothetical protein